MSNKSIAVSQYDGKKLLATYRSITQAATLTGVQPAHIGKVTNGIRKTAGGFSWKTIKSFTGKMKSGVTQSDIKGVVAVYTDADTAAKISGVRVGDINGALAGKRRTAGGFSWA